MSTSKRKLLVLTSSFPKFDGDINGNFVLELASRLTPNFEVYVLAPMYKGGLRFEEIRGLKVFRHKQFPINGIEMAYGTSIISKIKSNPLYFLVIPFFLLYQFHAIWHICKKEGIELIHAHWLIPQGMMAVLAKHLLPFPVFVISTAHGSDLNGFDNWLGNKLKAFTLDRSDAVTVVSRALMQKAMELDPKVTASVIPMGIDTKLFSSSRRDETLKTHFKVNGNLLLYVGELIEAKGIRDLVMAMCFITKKYPDAMLWIVGDGNLRNAMVSLVSELKLEDNILFLGPIPNREMPRYFATADFFVLPSYSEGWPVSVMEAMSCGTTPIVSDIPVFKSNQEIGQLLLSFKTGDVNDLAGVVCSAISNYGKYQSRKTTIRNYAETNFEWKIIANSYDFLLTCATQSCA